MRYAVSILVTNDLFSGLSRQISISEKGDEFITSDSCTDPSL